MRFRLRTLIIVLAFGPPIVAASWLAIAEWRQAQSRRLPPAFDAGPAVSGPLPNEGEPSGSSFHRR